MPVCAAAQELPGDVVQPGQTVYVRNDFTGPPTARCAYVLQTGQDYQAQISADSAAVADQQAMASLVFPLAVVVSFVLGWIAGAQR